MTKAYDRLASLVPRLQAVRTANGYLTEAGQSVLLGPVPRQPAEALPFIRLHETDAAAESAVPMRPTSKIRVQFMAEAYAEQPVAASLLATGHDLLADLKKSLFGDPMRDLDGNAIDARLEGYRIVQPEEGSDVVIAQVRGSFSFHDNFNAP